MRIILDLPFSEYLKDPSLSSHQAMEYLKSPLRYLHNKQNPKEATNAMIVGRAVHTIILEPHKFDEEFVEMPSFSQRKADQEAKAVFLEQCGGRQAIKASDFAMIKRIEQSFKQSDLHQEIQDYRKEVSLFFNAGGVQCKARIDALSLDGLYFVDLKTTEDPDPSRFKKEFFYYNYDFQMAFYQMAIRSVMSQSVMPTCYIFAIGKMEPIEITKHVVFGDVMEFGMGKVNKALEIHRQCLETQSWPTYDPKIAHGITL